MFWPTFTCQILIKFSFLESLWHKETDCPSFAKKNSIFANLQIFLQILKEEHKSFPMMYHLSYLDIKHGDLEGGGQIDPPPQHILVFKYPSRDRVNEKFSSLINKMIKVVNSARLPHIAHCTLTRQNEIVVSSKKSRCSQCTLHYSTDINRNWSTMATLKLKTEE